MSLPYCSTCKRTVTLGEIRDGFHTAHEFSVLERAAVDWVKAGMRCDTTECPCGLSHYCEIAKARGVAAAAAPYIPRELPFGKRG